MPGLPTHIEAALEARTGAPIGARWATAHHCPRCKQWTLTALDDDVMAIQATIQPDPVTHAGETAAVLAGWPTYELRIQRAATSTGRPRMYLIRRTPSRRQWWPAPGHPEYGATRGTGGPYDVHPVHAHGAVWPVALTATPTISLRSRPAPVLDTPPY